MREIFRRNCKFCGKEIIVYITQCAGPIRYSADGVYMPRSWICNMCFKPIFGEAIKKWNKK